MKKVTVKWLEKKEACTTRDQNIYYTKKGKENIFKILNILIKEKRFDWANWLITRYMNKKQNVQYAIFASVLSLNNFESRYSDDKRPRLAIEAAKNYVKNPCEKTKGAADSAAYSADSAYSAANSAANSAYSAAYSAYSAYSAADSAAYSAYLKIIKNGIKILKA